jgi:hypothetical protein
MSHLKWRVSPSDQAPCGGGTSRSRPSRKDRSRPRCSPGASRGGRCGAPVLLFGVLPMLLSACSLDVPQPKNLVPAGALPTPVRERGPDGTDRLVCEIRDAITVTGNIRISGIDTLRFVGMGCVNLIDADSQLSIRDCQLEWIIDDSTPADYAPVLIDGGILEVENVRSVVTAEVHPAPTSGDFAGPPMRAILRARLAKSVSVKAFDGLAEGQVPVMFFHSISPGAGIHVDRVHLRRMGAGIYLANFGTAVIEDFSAEDCNMSAIVAMAGDSINVDRARVRRQGRLDSRGMTGTGDGMTLDGIRSAVVRDSSFLEGGCYGISLLGGRMYLQLTRCELSGGITHAIYSGGANSPDLVPDRQLHLEGCRFVGNVGSDFFVVGFGQVELKARGESDVVH